MSRWSLEQLEAFLAICRLGSFRAAADHLGITQPAVSLRIRQLEEACGTTLFARRGGGVQPTAEGGLVRKYAERSLAGLEELHVRLQADDPWSSAFRLGASDLFAMTCLPHVLRDLQQRHPRLDIQLVATSSAALHRALERDELDAAFVANPSPRLDSTRVGQTLGRSDLVVVSDGSLGLHSVVEPGDLLGHRILVNPPPSTINDALREWFYHVDMRAPVFSTCNSLPVSLRLVGAGGGVGVVPRHLATQLSGVWSHELHLPEPRMRPLELALIHRPRAHAQIIDFLEVAARKAAGYALTSSQ
jgi:DNA-binding transcriptional LysR family regulator